jgi:hypothetical protein
MPTQRLEGSMLEVGDTVITMGAVGRFKVIAVAGPLLTIENADGIRKTVLEGNLRKIETAHDNGK